MSSHYLEKNDSTHTECGRSAKEINSGVIGGDATGVDCKQCLKRLNARGISAKPKWLLVCDECYGTDPLCKFDVISKSAQRKVLEYLRDVALITPEAYQSPKSIIIEMLKELEAK